MATFNGAFMPLRESLGGFRQKVINNQGIIMPDRINLSGLRKLIIFTNGSIFSNPLFVNEGTGNINPPRIKPIEFWWEMQF